MEINNIELDSPYLTLDSEFYDYEDIKKLDKPYIIDVNTKLLVDLGLENISNDEIVSLLNGSIIFKNSKPFAMCYAGHQFGNYNPRLGDGRVINLGKLNNYNLQLKGAGDTLYSRSDDGRATIASSIREYLMSEAMYHLGVPTTRAVAIAGSQTKLLRKQIQKAAIVMRASSSWVRFGTFEYFYYQKKYDKVKELADYVIDESYKHLKENDDKYYQLFYAIVEKTANLIAKWQAIGFCHGVMNTDNMSIDGVTLDYGPFSMLDDFEFNYVCNHTDKAGRYAYSQQVNISYWNLTKLAETFSNLVEKTRLDIVLEKYGSYIYFDAYKKEMRKKLGLDIVLEEDDTLIESLIECLQDASVDYTLFFRQLSHYDGDKENLYDIAMDPLVVDKWLKLYDVRLDKENKSSKQRNNEMLQVNPKFVLKNYILEEIISNVYQGKFHKLEEVFKIIQNPYDEHKDYGYYAGDTPEHYKNIGLSCSS
jgi:uncharacterized protein YdiU (UPF0061 family)